MKLLLILALMTTPALAEIPEHPADKADEAKERVWKKVEKGMKKSRLQQRLKRHWRARSRVYVAIAVVAGLYTVACTVDENFNCPWDKDE